MTGKNLRTWYKNWQGVREIILFGYGKTCKYHLEELSKNFYIKCIVDNDTGKQGMVAGQCIPVKSLMEIADELGKTKIVIFSAYEEISKQLIDLGLKEYKDFCEYRLLVTAWHWFEEKKVYLSEVHVAVTTKCTLNCRNCNMFIPKHREEKTACHVELEQLKKDFELLFSKVERIYRISLVGGETFLYPKLKELIAYVSSKYADKYQQIEIYTNGTVPLDDDICDLLASHNIIVTISNYENIGIAYKKKVNDLINLLKRKSISFVENTSTEWMDFAFPYDEFVLPDDKAVENMLLCNPGFRGFNDGKFYFCHIVWSAVLCNSLEDSNNDYIDFNHVKDNEEIVNYHLGIMNDRFVSLCKYCAGCSSLYRKSIPAAIQQNMEKEYGSTEVK